MCPARIAASPHSSTACRWAAPVCRTRRNSAGTTRFSSPCRRRCCGTGEHARPARAPDTGGSRHDSRRGARAICGAQAYVRPRTFLARDRTADHDADRGVVRCHRVADVRATTVGHPIWLVRARPPCWARCAMPTSTCRCRSTESWYEILGAGAVAVDERGAGDLRIPAVRPSFSAPRAGTPARGAGLDGGLPAVRSPNLYRSRLSRTVVACRWPPSATWRCNAGERSKLERVLLLVA